MRACSGQIGWIMHSRVRLEFKGTQLSSDGGLLVVRELDDAPGLSDPASAALLANNVSREKIAHWLTRPVRRPSLTKRLFSH